MRYSEFRMRKKAAPDGALMPQSHWGQADRRERLARQLMQSLNFRPLQGGSGPAVPDRRQPQLSSASPLDRMADETRVGAERFTPAENTWLAGIRNGMIQLFPGTDLSRFSDNQIVNFIRRARASGQWDRMLMRAVDTYERQYGAKDGFRAAMEKSLKDTRRFETPPSFELAVRDPNKFVELFGRDTYEAYAKEAARRRQIEMQGELQRDPTKTFLAPLDFGTEALRREAEEFKMGARSKPSSGSARRDYTEDTGRAVVNALDKYGPIGLMRLVWNAKGPRRLASKPFQLIGEQTGWKWPFRWAYNIRNRGTIPEKVLGAYEVRAPNGERVRDPHEYLHNAYHNPTYGTIAETAAGVAADYAVSSALMPKAADTLASVAPRGSAALQLINGGYRANGTLKPVVNALPVISHAGIPTNLVELFSADKSKVDENLENLTEGGNMLLQGAKDTVGQVMPEPRPDERKRAAEALTNLNPADSTDNDARNFWSNGQ